MINRQRLSNVLFFISTLIIMYAYWFEVRLSIELAAFAWSILTVSRTLIMFPVLKGNPAEIKIGKEIKR